MPNFNTNYVPFNKIFVLQRKKSTAARTSEFCTNQKVNGKESLNLKEQLLNLKHFLSSISYGDGGLILKVVTNLNVLLISKKSMEVWLWSSSITD